MGAGELADLLRTENGGLWVTNHQFKAEWESKSAWPALSDEIVILRNQGRRSDLNGRVAAAFTAPASLE